jgi:hypothetical protein
MNFYSYKIYTQQSKGEKMDGKVVITSILIILALIIFIGGLMYILPQYNVWQQGLSGKAALTKAEQTKLILIEQARAELESAKIRADAIEVMGEAAQKYPEYRLQEFMGSFATALEDGTIDQIIYVPTEANIPIMEATRIN